MRVMDHSFRSFFMNFIGMNSILHPLLFLQSYGMILKKEDYRR